MVVNKQTQKKEINQEGTHRMTLRIPDWLMERVDEQRKKRVGTVSRNLFILEILDNAIKKK